MLVEVMRSMAADTAPPGMLSGLGDTRLAPALQRMHANAMRVWTVGELAEIAAVSRSAFFERFETLRWHAHRGTTSCVGAWR